MFSGVPAWSLLWKGKISAASLPGQNVNTAALHCQLNFRLVSLVLVVKLKVALPPPEMLLSTGMPLPSKNISSLRWLGFRVVIQRP